jgi:hypothetical protein
MLGERLASVDAGIGWAAAIGGLEAALKAESTLRLETLN